jgi:APA family basic amino acid/polyamine antiporter
VNADRASTPPTALRRELGVWGATFMGLGSIVGTGVFVSIGVAAGAAGPAVLLAIAAAAGVATCNAFSSAQLAASHPVSGGTYEYGYEYLHPALGFTAGWMFLCAKSASAATAALGFAGYLLHAWGSAAGGGGEAAGAGAAAGGSGWLVPVAAVTAIVLTLVVVGGMRRSNVANVAIVSVTLAALAAFVAAGLPALAERGAANLLPFFGGGAGERGPLRALLYATALMFVAYTGYGRIATLGEEVREPRRTIPRAIVATLVVTAVLYLAVGLVAVGTVGTDVLYRAAQSVAAPLEVAAGAFSGRWLAGLVAVGAMTAMLGVLLNLLLGLSRVALAMGRRGDLPAAAARLDAGGTTPWVAVLGVGAVVTALTLVGSVETTWSFSAFTVLVYYALTNLAALRLPREDRLYSPAWAWTGLAACLFLAFWVDRQVWLTGLGLIAAGLAWHAWRQRRAA